MQRRALRRRAGVAADALECLHRHVELVALGILEHQELGGQAARVHGGQPEVAADAVVFVHHGCAWPQVGELLDDAGGVAVRASAPALLARAIAEQLLLGIQGDGRVGEHHARGERGDRNGDRRVAGEELVPAGDDARLDAERPQQVEQQFAATGGFRGQQHPPRMRGEPLGERPDRFLASYVEARGRRLAGAEIHRLDAGDRLTRAGAAEQQLAARARGRRPLGRRQAQLGWGEHRVLDVVAPLLVARLDGAPGLGQPIVVVRRERDHRAVGEVVEEARGRLEEQRQVVLDSRRRESLAHVAVQRHAREVALEARAVAAAEVADRFRREAEFARREQLEPREAVARALGVRVEAADAVHLPVEQVDAQWRLAAHRKNVEERAADGELAGGRDLRHAGVAGRRQARAKCLEVELGAHLQHEGVAVHEAARRQPLQRGRQVGDDDAGREAGQARERAQSLGDDVRVRRELVVGQGLVVRKGEHRERRIREEAQLILESRHFGGIAGDHEQRPPESLCCAREVQARGRAGEAPP